MSPADLSDFEAFNSCDQLLARIAALSDVLGSTRYDELHPDSLPYLAQHLAEDADRARSLLSEMHLRSFRSEG